MRQQNLIQGHKTNEVYPRIDAIQYKWKRHHDGQWIPVDGAMSGSRQAIY